ncbi:cytoplasmic protein [Salmonella enterica subsp. enterica serovar Panama]|uniref:Cytoplasmic protein n=1 Tax=Salmonella enterica subsp. enterica serovar Panama TaxID=29472 RepID=A0A619AFI6_SALET|nr:cytoplasmic protein [Salmonella enterica subsp. enterica serovar Panama]EGU5383789.1 cytoplasmic protein [Salmonella enterica]ECX3497845.1 cytoplasmic protein [Salmonella enterica subsp. enterica serovar Panama]ECX6035208.1 cytoplasmic protein [Salmonella enterica subsp. enterica serovar Panama]EGX1720570.1 cytoplasmic protein [Salmonella enterica subsp. enterica serovar Panama]
MQWENVYRHHRYTEEDLTTEYQAELRKYRDDTWEVPQRAARLSAAVKRYKTYEMLYFFFGIADEAGLDYTPLVVRRLCAHLFDRQGSQAIIVDIFGRKGRMHRSYDSYPDIIAAVAEQYSQQAKDYWQGVLKNIERVK